MEQVEKTQSFAYFWVNGLYMREIQWGIQALHCAVDMGQIYHQSNYRGTTAAQVYDNWANDGKTVILLNAFNLAGLREKFDLLTRHATYANVPWASFCEDEQSLGGIMTCVGVVASPNMMDYMSWAREHGREHATADERADNWVGENHYQISSAELAIAEDLMQGRLVS